MTLPFNPYRTKWLRLPLATGKKDGEVRTVIENLCAQRRHSIPSAPCAWQLIGLA